MEPDRMDIRQARYAAYRTAWRAAYVAWIKSGRPPRFLFPVKP